MSNASSPKPAPNVLRWVAFALVFAVPALINYVRNPVEGYWLDYAVNVGFGLLAIAAAFGTWAGLSRAIGHKPFIKSLAVIAIIFAATFLYFSYFDAITAALK